MAFRLVTCPETAHLELIDYDESPFGMLITACSRYPTCALDCPRTCSARIDRRCRVESMLEVGDQTSVDVLGSLR